MSDRPEVTWIPVGKLGEVRMGKQLSPTAASHPDQSPYLRVANVFEDRIDYNDVKTMHFSAREKEVFGLRSGDILLNEGQGSIELLGSSAVYASYTNGLCFQNTLIRFRPGSDLDSAYSQMIFKEWRRAGAFARVARQSSIAHLGADRFAAMPFPWIPLAEQLRIVTKVADVDELIALTRQQIQKYDDLELGVVRTTLESLPADHRLIDILRQPPRNGYSPRESPQRTGVYMLGLGCLSPRGFTPAQVKNAPPTIAQRPELLADGDILMSRANTRQLVGLVGRYRDIGSPCIYPDLMMRLRPGPRIRPNFLVAALSTTSARKMIMSRARGTSESMVKISGSIVSNLTIPVPPLDGQDRILELVGEPRRAAESLRAELVKLTQLKQAVTDALLPHPVSVHALVEPVIIEA
jgi:type I restriction enzyme, S subunit